MKKKILALTLIATMAFTLAACSSSNTSSEETTETSSEGAITSEVSEEIEEASETSAEGEEVTELVESETAETETAETETDMLIGTWVYEFETSEETAEYYAASGVTVGDTLESVLVLNDDGTGTIYLIDATLDVTLSELPMDTWSYSEVEDEMLVMVYTDETGQTIEYGVYYSSGDNTLYNINSEYQKVEE